MTGETVSADGVHIAGSLNGWNTEANQLEDQGNGIYALTLDLQPGADYEYKYLNGNQWGTEEAAPGDCTIGGSNRTFTAPTEDMMLPVVPFNGCPAAIPTQNVTFRVDMAGQTVGAEGVHVAGNFNGWNPEGTTLQLTSGTVYEATVPVLSSIRVLQYKFVNGNAWGSEETPGDGCANGDSNRPYTIVGAGSSVTLPMAVFGGCANPVPTKRVTFTTSLDAAADPAGVHVAGSFQGWNPEGTEMANIGGDTYQVEVDVMATTSYIEYKFLNGNAWGTDETVPASCSYNNNRFEILDIEVNAPVALPVFEFGTCNTLTVSTAETELEETFEVFPTIADEEISVKVLSLDGQNDVLSVYTMSGEVTYQKRLTTRDAHDIHRIGLDGWTPGVYIVELRTSTSQQARKIVVR
jgi:hypothetical protein